MPVYEAADGATLFFEDQGTGVPVMCLSGLTRNHSDFAYALPHLHGVRVLRPDYRGRGRSDWADPATYTIPTEAQDALALLDHLGLDKAAIIGTSRGGLIAMTLAAVAKDRLAGVCLVDIGPELATEGLDVIRGYIGKDPVQKTYGEAAAMRAALLPGFEGVPDARWQDEVRMHYRQTSTGLKINYDPRLADAVVADGTQQVPDLWPLFDALDGLPLSLIRGANSNLLSLETANEMCRRRPDMGFANVPGRGHVPFLDEPEALAVIGDWLEKLT